MDTQRNCNECLDYDRDNGICGRWHFTVAINRYTGNPQRLLLCIEEEDSYVETVRRGSR